MTVFEPGARRRALVMAVAVGAVALAGCASSSAKRAEPAPRSSVPSGSAASAPASTADPNTELNPLPYDVGEIVALPGGWRAQVVRVRRGYTAPGLTPPNAGDDHVAVDVRLTNDEHPSVRVDPAALFTLFDQSNNEHAIVVVPGMTQTLDGAYAPGTEHTGTLVFSGPVRSQLLLVLDGSAIGSSRSVFQVDPPKHPTQD